jgi:hypothetical protein
VPLIARRRVRVKNELVLLPELAGARKEPNAFTGEFSSAQRILDYPQTVTLLKKHRLMVDDKSAWDDDELLR